MDLDKLKNIVEKFANHYCDKYGVKNVEVSFIEKGGGENHYMLGFRYHMKEGNEPLGGRKRQDLTFDIVTNFNQIMGIKLTTITTSSISSEGKKSWF